MHKPNFITFTGIDDWTDLAAARQLAAEYPVEYGVLFSPERQGVQPRYPSWSTVHQILARTMEGKCWSAHLCGGHARNLLACAATSLDSMLLDHFSRVQINTAMRGIDTQAIAEWASALKVDPILQFRNSFFPIDDNVEWLFDASGGRGIAPATWPKPPSLGASSELALCGYAGGLNPDNVASAVAAIGAADEHYWIDMETGVRDENDRFSLDKCRAVCEAVFGPLSPGEHGRAAP